MLLLLLLSTFLDQSGINAASFRDHRLRGAESNAPSPNEDMLKALEYIQNLRQNAKSQDQQSPDFERSLGRDQQSVEPRLEDKSEELLQAVLSTLQQTEKEGKPNSKSDNAKVQPITPHKEMPLLFEDDEKADAEDAEEEMDHSDNYKRTNENVEEKYTPQNLATLQSVFDELGKMNFNFNSKRENSEEDDGLFNTRDAVYDEGDWDQEEEEEGRQEFERALDYLEDTEQDNEQENDASFITKRSQDQDEGEMANLADFYLLKVLEQTEEEEQKKREIEEEEEEERRERSATEFKNNIDPKMIYRLLQISQKYQIPPEDLVDMLRTGEITRLKVAPIYTKKTYKKPDYFTRRLPIRQKTPEEMRTERVLKILGLSGDQNNAQSPFRKHYTKTTYSPIWRQGSMIARQPQPKQRFPTKLKDDYDDTENELATFLAARMLSKYPTYKTKMNQKREETEEEEVGSFERAVRDYFDQLDSDRNENKQSDLEQRGAEDFDNEEVMKLLSFVNPDTEQDAKNTE
ncbi:secretogranin-2b [Boleophthalmus pectinirostris]|uniref:secretogranin-2b n=1 Tax=Boleophthalmus pectinirostris TaxID=150288 RepID=UPI000A1C4B0F|nr:secretogranin-2b [Boleophthalmus pectinirostris]